MAEKMNPPSLDEKIEESRAEAASGREAIEAAQAAERAKLKKWIEAGRIAVPAILRIAASGNIVAKEAAIKLQQIFNLPPPPTPPPTPEWVLPEYLRNDEKREPASPVTSGGSHPADFVRADKRRTLVNESGKSRVRKPKRIQQSPSGVDT